MTQQAVAVASGQGASRVEPSRHVGGAEVYAIGAIAGLVRAPRSPFRGTCSITLPQVREFAATLDIFASSPDRVERCYDDATETAVYLWGRATHQSLRGENLLLHIATVARSSSANRLRDVMGNFVVLLDDRRRRRITFISDVLGLRPWYFGSHRGQLIAGGDVLGICSAGFSNGKPDYDAISCWLKFNHDCTSGSVVADYRNTLPGVIATFAPTGALLSQIEYAKFEFTDTFLPPDQMADRIHDAAARSFSVQTRGLAEVNLPLSGGYDSRLLLALGCAGGLNMHAQTMKTREHEVRLATEAAAALNYPLEIVSGRRKILDLFEDPFAFTPAGFPTGRNLTSALARRWPGMPLLSGFLGDGVMRGSMTAGGTARWAKDRAGLSADQLIHDTHHDYALHTNRFHLLRNSVARNIEQRSMQCIRRVIERGIAAGKPILYADLHTRHRFYFANIFLQHLDVAEAILPFHAWELINLRTSYDQRCYTGESYRTLFRRHHPALAGVGHTSDFFGSSATRSAKGKTTATRHLRRFAAEVAATLIMTDCLEGMRRKRILSLLPGALLGEPRFADEVQFAYKLQLFERSMRRHRISFDWNAI